jgi:D-lyxose ketol-isomerase
MKRSQINKAIDAAHAALRDHGVRLPAYGYWSPDDWRNAGSEMSRVTRNGLGWAVTDFGQGDFDRVGITMFDVRNGNVERPEEGTPYGEKIFVLQPGQRLPYHFHWKKTEDIISYHGGTLMIQLFNANDDETMNETSPGVVYLDGGEISTISMPRTDNRFGGNARRFVPIEEDEPARWLLNIDYPRLHETA